jgi:hypothetical protein
MARTGLYKSEVEKARNSLIAQGRHPSVDAVRIALGNTGSKTTIHKYLKELEEENGGTVDRQVTISAALQNLVAQLATQLEAEASSRIADMSVEVLEKDRLHAAEIEEVNAKHTQTKEKLDLTIAAIKQEIDLHEQTREALQSESMTRHTLAQQVMTSRSAWQKTMPTAILSKRNINMPGMHLITIAHQSKNSATRIYVVTNSKCSNSRQNCDNYNKPW